MNYSVTAVIFVEDTLWQGEVVSFPIIADWDKNQFRMWSHADYDLTLTIELGFSKIITTSSHFSGSPMHKTTDKGNPPPIGNSFFGSHCLSIVW